MHLRATSGYSEAPSARASGPWLQRREDYQALARAVRAGDAEAAQAALETLEAHRAEFKHLRVESAGRDARTDVIRSDFAKLVSAVESGDMDAAAEALDTLESDRAAFYTRHEHSRSPRSEMRRTFMEMVSAVRAGDLEGAQKALKALEELMQSRHGHGRRGRVDEPEAPATPSEPTSSSGGTAGTTCGPAEGNDA